MQCAQSLQSIWLEEVVRIGAYVPVISNADGVWERGWTKDRGFGDTVEGKVISRDCFEDKSPPFPRKGERSTFTTRNFMSPLQKLVYVLFFSQKGQRADYSLLRTVLMPKWHVLRKHVVIPFSIQMVPNLQCLDFSFLNFGTAKAI